MLKSGDLVSVRCLPNGARLDASVMGAPTGQTLRLYVEAGDPLAQGALVEIDSAEALLFGQVCGKQAKQLIVYVEHAVDRKILEKIQAVWSVSDGI